MKANQNSLSNTLPVDIWRTPMMSPRLVHSVSHKRHRTQPLKAIIRKFLHGIDRCDVDRKEVLRNNLPHFY